MAYVAADWEELEKDKVMYKERQIADYKLLAAECSYNYNLFQVLVAEVEDRQGHRAGDSRTLAGYSLAAVGGEDMLAEGRLHASYSLEDENPCPSAILDWDK